MQKKAFTLIELMIVVAIIGILAAIAVPNFVKFQCRSKQSEAKGNLKSMYVAQEAYRGEYDKYSNIGAINSAVGARTATNPPGWQPKADKLRYGYNATGTSGSAPTFDGFAKGSNAVDTKEMSGDNWSVSELNDVCNTASSDGSACSSRASAIATNNICD